MKQGILFFKIIFTFTLSISIAHFSHAHENHDDAGFKSEFITVQGELETISFDDFVGKKSVKKFFLIDSQTNKKYELHFKNNAPFGFSKRQKAKIRGQLFSADNIMVNVKDVEFAALDGSSSSGTSGGTAAAAPYAGVKKTLVISIDSFAFTGK